MNSQERTTQLLLAFGAALFFLGLISGFLIPILTNPRMGLSGHLEGVMNGIFLIIIGLAWSRLRLSPRTRSVTYWSLIYATFANWIFVMFAAVFGTGSMAPIAGSGYAGLPWQEMVVTLGLVSVGIVMLLACGLLVWGFFSKLLNGDRNEA